MNNENMTTRNLYVSADGTDAWSGRMPEPNADRTDGPFATLARAQGAIRALKKAAGLPPGGITVTVRGGEYLLAGSLAFTAEDSGTVEAPVLYRAAEGETVRLIGGRRIDPAAFQPVTDPVVRGRLSEAARDRVVRADLHALDIADFGAFASRGFNRKTAAAHLELFFNDQPMTVAQWPNAGEFATIAGFTKTITNEWGQESGDLTGGFTYEGGRPKRWEPSDDIWVHGYWAYDWASSYERVRRLDPEACVVETEESYGHYHFAKGQRFYFLNVLEELDQPGEYYVDRARGILYFWPPTLLEGADILVSVLDGPMLRLDDVHHASFRGLTLEAARGNGIEINGGEGVSLVDCTIRNLGNWAMRIVGGTNHAVTGCVIYGTGDGGVNLTGGDRATLTPCDHAVLNCHIHHYARWSRCYVAGINANGVGMRLARNLIHDAPHNAILFTGNEFLIENNEIHHVCLETGDAGAIYTGRDYTYRGNIIRRNFIHHMGGVGMGSIAIYMDDCVSGTRIEENILWKCQYGIMLGGGRDFVVANNVFVECQPAIHADARGVDANPVWQKMVKVYMKERLESMRHNEPPYSVRYPEIAGVDAHYAAGGGVPPENNRVERNLAFRCAPWIGKCWPKVTDNGITETNNLVGAGHWFVAPEAGDFRLRPDAPAAALGFRPIPVETIGLPRPPKEIA